MPSPRPAFIHSMALRRPKRFRGRKASRRLSIESLELRRVLATFLVDTVGDTVVAGDGMTSLREAILLANDSSGVDTIAFSTSLTSPFSDRATIDLSLGELVISESVIIAGPDAPLTIDAGGNSRHFNISPLAADVTIDHLVLSGGLTTADNEGGGAIRFFSGGTLRLNQTTLVNNATSGGDSPGGAIYSLGVVELSDSLITGNKTTGDRGHGGGIYLRDGSFGLTNSEVSANSTEGRRANGGGIYTNAGTVTLTSSVVANNRTTGDESDGGGVFAIANVTVATSSITGNSTMGEDADGGGISVRGDLSLQQSIVRDNRTMGKYAAGGGIASSDGVLTVTASSVTENATSGELGYGGGIFSVRGDVLLDGSTLSQNTTAGSGSDGGGLAGFFGNLTITSSTITQNTSSGKGGGISFFDNTINTLEIHNSIVADNTDSGIAPDFLAPTTSSRLLVTASLIGDNTGTGLPESQSSDTMGNLVGAPSPGAGLIDPQVDALRFNGLTFTHPLQAGSPAINSGDNSRITISFDQRGEPFARISGARVDMGSFEFQTIDDSQFIVTTNVDELDFSDGEVSLREAMRAAAGNPGLDEITFDASVFAQSQSVDLLLGELLISDAVTITGPGPDSLTINAQGNSRIFYAFGSAGDVTLSGMTITGGSTSDDHIDNVQRNGSGGAIRFVADAALTIVDAVIIANQTTGQRASGGGIFFDGSELMLLRTSVENNRTDAADAHGGGIAVASGNVLLRSSVLADNFAVGESTLGGGIHSQQGKITVIDSSIVDNVAASGGGIAADLGGITASGSVISGNAAFGNQGPGGGIHAKSGLTSINESKVTGNRTDGLQSPGGGIYSAASGGLFVTRSEISGNSTRGLESHGGGIAAQSANIFASTVSFNATKGAADGGGIHATNLVLNNSTISSNRVEDDRAAAGGIVALTSTIESSTIAFNTSAGRTGGIEMPDLSTAQLAITNSILAKNSDDGTAPDLFHPAGHAGTLSVAFSLIGTNTGSDLSRAPTADASGNLIGSDTVFGNIDPLLGALANHGGFTATHPLQADSPAINRGNATLARHLTNDGRGAPFVRVAGGAVDMGAYERQTLSPSQLIVNTVLDELDESNLEISLREAISHANGSVGADAITFDPSVFASATSIPLTLGELAIGESVTIIGPGRDLLTIDAQANSRVIHFSADAGNLTISRVTITGGSTTSNGGAIDFASSTGTLTLANMNVTGNTAAGHGGGVHSAGIAIIRDSLVADNVSGGRGGGIFSDAATLTGTIVEDNQANGRGGGMEVGQADLIDTVIRNNIATGDGGGVLSTRSLNVSESVIHGNSAQGRGGGIFTRSIDSPALEVSMSSVSFNSAAEGGFSGSGGGGIYVEGDALIADSTISGNVTTGSESDGGGIFVNDGALEITRSTIANNTAQRAGGGVLTAFIPSATLSINGSIFAGNSDLGIAPNFRVTQNPAELAVQFSLIDDNTGTTLGESQTPDASGNLIGRPAPFGSGVIDAMLGPLTTIGGTQVHPLLSGSPAMNLGSHVPPLPSFDQRGAPFVRVFDGSIDMGSFEFQPPGEPVIDWPDPAAIVVGTPLGDVQLNANANTPGTFVYTPAGGTILGLGNDQLLSVDFTPDDSQYFLPTSAMVSIDVVEAFDFGDAPDSLATLLASDGPRHLTSSLRLGDTIDFEPDGQPSDRASADGSDEDGVIAITSFVTDANRPTIASVLVNASAAAKLDAWFDFNGNGQFDHPDEHLGGGTSIQLSRGDNVVEVTVPAAAATGITFARFRLSSAGGLLPTGPANDGEVEDYQFVVFDGADLPVVDVDLPRGPATLSFELGELFIVQRGKTLFRAFGTQVGRYNILATEFSDVLVLDNSDGPPLPGGGMTFDGGDRVNTLRLAGVNDDTLDTTRDSNVTLRNIDVIDLTDAGAMMVIVDAASVREMDPGGGGVILTGGQGDRVVFADTAAWRMSEPTSVAGFSFSNVTTLGTFVQVDFASPWQNLIQASDINNDGNVTAGDALRVINELARRSFSDPETSRLKDPGDVSFWPNVYFDQNGDGNATALDALRVINELARVENPASGEGELVVGPIDLPIRATAASSDSARLVTEIDRVAASRHEDVGISQMGQQPFAGQQSFSGRQSSLANQTASKSAVDSLWSDREFIDNLASDQIEMLGNQLALPLVE